MEFAVRQPVAAQILNPLTSLYEKNRSSDLTVYCKGRTYSVHRAVLRARSQFFDGACRNPIRESEAGWIDLSEDDPEAVEHMISYFYNLDYLPAPQQQSCASSEFDLDAPRTPSLASTPTTPLSPTLPATPTQLATPRQSERRRRLDLSQIEDPLLATAAANAPRPAPKSKYLSKFGVTSPLVALSEDKSLLAVHPERDAPLVIDTMMKELTHDSAIFTYFDEDMVPDQVTDYTRPNLVAHAKVYAIAEQYGIKGLKILAKKKFAAQITAHRESPELAQCLPEVYEGTVENDRGLREIIVSAFRQFPELAQMEDVEQVVRDLPGLAYELFRVAWGLPI